MLIMGFGVWGVEVGNGALAMAEVGPLYSPQNFSYFIFCFGAKYGLFLSFLVRIEGA